MISNMKLKSLKNIMECHHLERNKKIMVKKQKQAHQKEVYRFHGLHGDFSFLCDAKDITHRRAKAIKPSLRFV